MAMATQTPTESGAARVRGGYEIANALGRLNADRPKLGQRCTEEVTIARVVRYFLHALDLYQQATGCSLEHIAHLIRVGRIELRLQGGRAVVVTP